jgi:hypothetical protein
VFNIQSYFELIEKVLHTNRGRFRMDTEGVFVAEAWDNWTIVRWEARIDFESGHALRVFELYTRNYPGAKVMKCVAYHFMDEGDRCVFRFDTHGGMCPVETPCHVHLGEKEEQFESGDGRLGGFSLERVNFLTAYRLAHRRIKAKSLPWE